MKARANVVVFVVRLQEYAANAGRVLFRPPQLQGQRIDLYQLFLAVCELGGCHAVEENNLWPVVAAERGYDSQPKAAQLLSSFYVLYLRDFELHLLNEAVTLHPKLAGAPRQPQAYQQVVREMVSFCRAYESEGTRGWLTVRPENGRVRL